jgi:hypothetical protein
VEYDMNNICKTLIATLLIAVAGAGGAVRAQLPPATVIEGSVETTTDAVIFPSGLDGRLQVRGCEGCEHPTLQLDRNTQCILAGRVVSLRDMAANAQQNSARPLTISYRLRDLVVSRIVVLEK